MDINRSKVQFNFLKNLEISTINMEVDQLHPSTHEFWEEDNVRKSLLDFLVGWSRNPKAYVKKTHQAQDDATHALKSDEREESEIELGFGDDLFELFKLRCDIEKAKAAIVTTLDRFYSIHSFVFDPVQLKI